MTYPAPTPGPWKPANRREFWLKGPGLIGLIVFGALAVFIPLSLLEGAAEPAGELQVRVVSCEVDQSGNATAGVEVTNGSGRAADVAVELEYRDAGGVRLDTDTLYVWDIAAGDTARGEEMTGLDAASSSVVCHAVQVRRL